MERNFETVMIEQCAPVLAGLKPAGLFRYETRDCADLARRVRSWNEQLAGKGLSVRVLKGLCADAPVPDLRLPRSTPARDLCGRSSPRFSGTGGISAAPGARADGDHADPAVPATLLLGGVPA